MALVAICGFRRNLGTRKSLSFVRFHDSPSIGVVMLMVAPDSCSCRRCSFEIEKGEHISWAGGPYHLACTPLSRDWDAAKAANFYRQSPIKEPKRKPWSNGDFVIVAVVAAIPVLVLLIAMLPGHPYDYFVFLRWVVFIAALGFVVQFHSQQLVRWMYGFGFIVFLYNPIFPVHLTRAIWFVLNAATIAAFVAGLAILVMNERRYRKTHALSE